MLYKTLIHTCVLKQIFILYIKAGLTDYLIPFQKYVCVKPLFIMNISNMGLERKVEWSLGTHTPAI